MARSIKLRSLLVVMLIGVFLLAACGKPAPASTQGADKGATGATAAPIVFKLEHPTTAESINGRDVAYFAKVLEEKSNGHLKVQIFNQGALTGGSGQAELDQMLAGTIDMIFPTSGYYGTTVPATQIISMPFFYSSFDTLEATLNGPTGKTLNDLWAKQGVEILGWYPRTARQITNSKRPILKPEDMKGIKIRVMDSPQYTATMKALGAIPTPMPFGELYTALQLKTVDAQENPVDITATEKLYEVQKYVSLWDYSSDALVLMMNKEKFDSLSADDQKLVLDAAKEAQKFHRDTTLDEYQKSIDFLKSKGLQVDTLTADQKATFQPIVKPLWAQFGKDIGPDIVTEAQKTAQ